MTEYACPTCGRTFIAADERFCPHCHVLGHAGSPLSPAKFSNVTCSQCGRSFGPGDHGFSRCKNHRGMDAIRES